MNVYPRRELFYKKPRTSIYRLFFLVVLILGGVWLIRGVDQGEIERPFTPTATPTRSVDSYALEGDAQFIAGNLDESIAAYREAVRVDPSNAQIWAKLARIQTYSSALLATDPERRSRLTDALGSIDQAMELAPDDSTVHAMRAFVLDWNANSSLLCTPEELAVAFTCDAVVELLTEAEQEAIRALQLDNQNTLALAFYAEILVDQQKWNQAEQNILQALEREDADSLMDVHRVYAYVLESLGLYNQAIQEYDKAILVSPNLTFLYLRAGANYRRLAFGALNEDSARQLYEKSLEYFQKAAQINEQLGVLDPVPYLSIAKTYSQTGDYFAAALNVQKALDFDPGNADTYGQLGIVFFKSRNYEGSIPALKCAVRGCTAEESCEARGGCNEGDAGTAVTGLALSPNTVVYYYTYGSVLAALSRPKDNKCGEAIPILNEVAAAFPGDSDIAGIVQAGLAICAQVGTAPGSAATPLPVQNEALTSTPTP
ncbi:MAG: tetratricopeptide repeat protein [Anaerolineaceae bacterium]|nr:MAG: tetratricopeptide repeat protein [Anaerolineaceae bacterium]